MKTKEERVWPHRAPPDASAGFNMFSGQQTNSGSSEGTSCGHPITGAVLEEVDVPGDAKGEKSWSSRPHPDASAGLNSYSHDSMGSMEDTSFGAPVIQDGVTILMDGLSQMSGRIPPLDNLLTPRSSPASSLAGSFIFDGSVPFSARRGSPLQMPTSSHTSPDSSSSSPAGSPIVSRSRASAPNPPHYSSSTRRVGFQPRVPNSPNTGPWHGRSFADQSSLTPRTPSPSDQPLSEFGKYGFGGPSRQVPMKARGTASVDYSTMRNPFYGHQSIGFDAVQSSHSSIPPTPNRRLPFPVEMTGRPWNTGAQDMMQDTSAMNRPSSVPASPACQRSPRSRGFGNFGRLEASNGKGGGNYFERVENLEPASTGNSVLGVLEDAIRAQLFERVAALLEQGFSPNGEQGSSKIPPLLYAVTTGNEKLVKLLLNAGANINGCDHRQYTALHYAATYGHRGILNILVAAGANLYAKTDGDLLPVQLTADQAIYEFLSTRMKSDLEERISPRQANLPSPRPPARPSLQRIARADRDQWIDDPWLANSRSTGFTDVRESGKSMQMNSPGVYVNAGEGGNYHDGEVSASGQKFGEGISSNIVMKPDFGRQYYHGSGRLSAGANAMDWELYRHSPRQPIYQGYDQRAFIANQGPNVVTEERTSFEQSQAGDVWMRDGTSNSAIPRPVAAQMLLERPPPQRAASVPVMMQHEIEAIQQDLIQKDTGPQAQQISSPKVALQQRAPSVPAGLGKEMKVIQKDWLEKTKPSEEAQVAADQKPNKQESRLQENFCVTETENSRVGDVIQESDSDDDDPHRPILPVQKKFSHACDSMAPSMMEKFRATSSATDFSLHMLSFEGASSDKAPETLQQEAESQEKSVLTDLERSGGASSSSEKGNSNLDAHRTPALKGDVKKQKEKKKSVTFAIPDSPSEEDLALIREDWHEAARSGCVGCGKPGCDGHCLSPDKSPPASCNEAASCSNSSSSSSKGVPEKAITDAKPTQTGSFRWTRGELLGEGAYGKVFAGLNQETGELMAVKQLKLDTPAEGQERQFYLAALEREISLYKTMRHKHIVGYIDMEQDVASGSLYVFLEYVSGGSIQSMLERFGRFSEPLVRVYTRQLLLGLEYLHGKKIVHRDIKGGNVLVDADGVVKLADFGASKAFHDPAQTDGFKSIRGSVFWMAPEVIKGDGYGRRADIWSVGCTVVEMLTAVHPWPGMDNTWTAIFHIAKASSGPPIPDGISEVVKDFLSHCFQLEAKNRPTATELLQHPFVSETSPQAT